MKGDNPSQKIKEILLQTDRSSVQICTSYREEFQKNRLAQNFVPNDRVLYQSIVENNVSLSQNAASESPNHLATLALAINTCLNTQSKMADTISEIGLYLKDIDMETANTLNPRKQTYVPNTTYLNYSLNNTSTKVREDITKKSTIGLILSKLENLKKEIAAKIFEFENYLSVSKVNHLNQIKDLNSQLDEFPPNVSPKQSFSQLQQEYGSIIKQPDEKSISEFPNLHYMTSPPKTHMLSVDFNKRCKEPISDSLHINKLNLSVQRALSPSKNFGSPKMALSQNKTYSSNYQNYLGNPKEKECSDNEKVSSDTNATSFTLQDFKKQILPLKIEEVTQLKVASDNKSTQLGHKRTETVHLQSNKTTHSAHNELKKIIGSSQNQKEAKKGQNVPLHRPTHSVSFTTELNVSFGALKNVIKPSLTIIPQKQIIDENVTDGATDKAGLKSDRSALIKNTSPRDSALQERLQIADTDRVDFAPELEGLQLQTQSFIRNIANKEKTVIKSLIKDEITEESTFKFKGKVPQNKCLINAKWWRIWKDFVNFDADDENNCKSSFFEGELYPRPGPINNKELLRQEALYDLGNITAELELKDNLLEHHDYEGVSKKVYDVLVKWYGADFEICRVLRPDPFLGNKSYLELYPKKKAVGRSNQKSFDASIGVDHSRMIKNILKSNLNQA